MTAPTQHFGKRVLGTDEYERQANAVKAHQQRGIGLGSRVTGASPSPRALKEAARKAAAEAPRHGDTERDTPPVAVEDAETGLPSVVDAPPAEEPAPPAEEPAPDEAPDDTGAGPKSEVAQMSIEQMKAALKENTSLELFDTLIDLELNHRPEGRPRKGALQELLAAEQARETPREAIVNELKRAIAGT